MIVSLRKLKGNADDIIDFDYTIDLTGEEVNFQHPFKSPVRISGEITDKYETLRLVGCIEAEITTSCSRCNVPVVYQKAVDVAFDLASSSQSEDNDDIYVVEAEDIELDDIFVPELIMDMEMAVLCKEDCAGICSVCGHNLNEGECGCNRKVIDPRLEKLAEILNKLEDKNN